MTHLNQAPKDFSLLGTRESQKKNQTEGEGIISALNSHIEKKKNGGEKGGGKGGLNRGRGRQEFLP